MTPTINNDNNQSNKQVRPINHKIVSPIPLEDLNKRKSTAITRLFQSNRNKIVPSTTYNTYRHNTKRQHKSIQASQVNKIKMEIDSTSSTYSKNHTEPIVPQHLATQNNIIISPSYDNSIHYVTSIIQKNQ